MSKKMKRRFSSASFSLQKASLRLAKYRPSPFLVAAAVMGASIFLLGGGIYDIFMEPLTILPIGGGRFLSYVPYRIHEQLLMGSIGVMILYSLGAVGLLLIYQSTRYIRKPQQVSLLSKVGVALFLVSFVAVEFVLYWILHFQ
ncbi:MAG: hypothetical protein NWE76_02490 [Candidatus Bathyarchaeota archaeon]|nr:hypothetical protein [Candidatus Bathyarchaeota archaeon]